MMADPSSFAPPPRDPQLPDAPTPLPSHDAPQLPPGFDALDDPAGGSKRKRNADPGGASARSKRSRYISIACNECKRRKIKCNGEVPCLRCGNLNLECIYAPNCCSSNFRDTTEYKQMQQHIYSLQDQLDGLWHTVNHIRGLLAPSDIPIPPAPPARLDLFPTYDARPLPNIDPTLGPHERKQSAPAPEPDPVEPQPAEDADPPHPAGHVPAQQSGARYAPPPPAPVSARDSSSQLSYELARASMASMGIAGADGALRDVGREGGHAHAQAHEGGRDGAQTETEEDEARAREAAAVAAAATAAAANTRAALEER